MEPPQKIGQRWLAALQVMEQACLLALRRSLWSILLLLVPLMPLRSTLLLQLLQLRLLFRSENPVQLRHGVLMQFLHLGALLVLIEGCVLMDRLRLRLCLICHPSRDVALNRRLLVVDRGLQLFIVGLRRRHRGLVAIQLLPQRG